MNLVTARSVEAKKDAYDAELDAALAAATATELVAAASDEERLTPLARFHAIGERVLALTDHVEGHRPMGELISQKHTGKIELGDSGLAIVVRATTPFTRRGSLIGTVPPQYVEVSWVKSADTESIPFASEGVHIDNLASHRVMPQDLGTLLLMEQSLDVAELARHDSAATPAIATT